MSFPPIVSAAWLGDHIDDPDLRIVDGRWYLGDPAKGPAVYRAGHIRGAVFMDLDIDLCAPVGPGRHPLPDPAAFAAMLGRYGIHPGSAVIAYDDAGGAVAARLWWMLRDLGHERVAVLDGGLAAWDSALLETTDVVPEPTKYAATPGKMPQLGREDLARRLGTVVTLDARAGERYRGETEPIDPVAGHIPTAVSAPLADNLDATGRFKSPDELAERFTALGASGATPVVMYCGSGATACHNILAMELAGLATPALYPGSWSDWCTAGMPAAVGPDPGTWPI